MIQRMQSVWLFLAAMINGSLFITKLYGKQVPPQTDWTLVGVRENIALFIVAALITVLPLIAIFLFKDRKRQKGLVILSIIGIIGFLSLAVMQISNIQNSEIGTKVQYNFGILIPILAVVFLVMAIRGINKDEKLIKSLDRLR